MFRCSECGAVYELKPDFCDCGNDIFVEEISQDLPQQNDYGEYEKLEDDLGAKHKKTFDEQYPMLARIRNSLDPISVIIFVLCIISSILVMIFIKPNEEPEAKPVEQVESVKREVPDINSFWNDELPKFVREIQREEEQVVPAPVEEQPKPVVVPVQPVIKTPVNPVKKVVTKQPVKQSGTTAKPKQNAVTSQPKKQTQSSPAVSIKQTATQQNTQTQKQPQNNTQKPTTSTTSTPVVAPVTNLKPIQHSYNNTQSLQELKNYKVELRNSLFSKINFSRIIGDGSCTVVFSVDSSGKLINRSFSKQSSNNTLNDEVYAAIMATPYFKKPPSGYKGQKMSFTVKFTSGKYSVSLN